MEGERRPDSRRSDSVTGSLPSTAQSAPVTPSRQSPQRRSSSASSMILTPSFRALSNCGPASVPATLSCPRARQHKPEKLVPLTQEIVACPQRDPVSAVDQQFGVARVAINHCEAFVHRCR